MNLGGGKTLKSTDYAKDPQDKPGPYFTFYIRQPRTVYILIKWVYKCKYLKAFRKDALSNKHVPCLLARGLLPWKDDINYENMQTVDTLNVAESIDMNSKEGKMAHIAYNSHIPVLTTKCLIS